MAAIPQELQDVKQWTFSYSEEELKRPKDTSYKTNGGLTYELAKQAAGENRYVGFYTTKEDPYILVDVDHINPEYPLDDLPPKFREFIGKNLTYCELSPSGKGIRFVYKLPDAKDKDLVQGNTFYTNELEQKKNIQVSLGPPWNTITENRLSFSKGVIATVDLEQLSKPFKIRFKVTDLKGKDKTTFAQGAAPNFKVFSQAVLSIPLDQNPRVVRGYERLTGNTYEHYAFWLKILMGIHHYSTVTNKAAQCLDLAVSWSSNDPDKFDGVESIIKRWEKFDDERDEAITFRTVLGIAKYCRIVWPFPAAQKKFEIANHAPLKPINTQVDNFYTLMDHYGIEFYSSSSDFHQLYISGDEDILEEYFVGQHEVMWYFDKYLGPYDYKTLAIPMVRLAQNNGFIGVSSKAIKTYVEMNAHKNSKPIDFFRLYIETPFEDLPEEMQENGDNYAQSTFDALWSCINVKKSEPAERKSLYSRLFKAWWLGLLRNMYYEGIHRSNSGILLLTGIENTFKTSFFRYLFPKFFRRDTAFTTHGFSNSAELRDITKIAATHRLVVFDEIEQHLKDETTEAYFKKLLDNEPQTLIDKYETLAATYVPIALYGGTSNRSTFNLSMLGMRRLFHIPVDKIDTDRELAICWHAVLNELKTELLTAIDKGEHPWLLSDDDINMLSSVNVTLKSTNNVDMVLTEIFNFEHKFDFLKHVTSVQKDTTFRLMSLPDIHKVVLGYDSSIKVNRKGLAHSLERLCATYTNTIRKDIHLDKPSVRIEKGQALQTPHKRWVMPPIRDEVYPNIQVTLAQLL